MDTQQTVNIKIRTMHGLVSTSGLFLEDGGNFLVPKLVPGQVVAVPTDHPIFKHPSSEHVQLTHEKPTRPYEFDDEFSAAEHATGSRDAAMQFATGVQASVDASAAIREENRLALEEAKRNGTYRAEPMFNFGTEDRAAGLSPVDPDNAVIRDTDDSQIAQVAAAPVAPPPSGRRRGRRTS